MFPTSLHHTPKAMRHLFPLLSPTARRAFYLFAIVVVALVWATVSVLSASGDLDPSFNGTGKAMFDFGIKGTQARDVTIQTDGKIVASGKASIEPLRRYRARFPNRQPSGRC